MVPELLQDDATPDRLADALEAWLADTAATERLVERFTELHLTLRQNTAEKAAAAILPYLTGKPEWDLSKQPV
jgi:lipid-A-disaccharide synthase